MSIPVIPGYIDGPTPTRLLDLWQRPVGEYPDELWPTTVLGAVTPDPTGWLTVCEHYTTPTGHGGQGCVLVVPDDGAAALTDTGWLGHDLGNFSVWYNFEGEHGFDSGLQATERDARIEFFVHVRRPVGSSDPVVEISQPFLWYFDAYPVEGGWAYLNEAGRPQELVRTQVSREHWIIEVRALEFRSTYTRVSETRSFRSTACR